MRKAVAMQRRQAFGTGSWQRMMLVSAGHGGDVPGVTQTCAICCKVRLTLVDEYIAQGAMFQDPTVILHCVYELTCCRCSNTTHNRDDKDSSQSVDSRC